LFITYSVGKFILIEPFYILFNIKKHIHDDENDDKCIVTKLCPNIDSPASFDVIRRIKEKTKSVNYKLIPRDDAKYTSKTIEEIISEQIPIFEKENNNVSIVEYFEYCLFDNVYRYTIF